MDQANKQSLKYGLWCGLTYMGLTILLYFVDKTFIINPGFQLLSGLITIFFMIIGMKKVRMENGNTMDFNLGLRSGFLIAITASLMYWLLIFTIYATDPNMAEVTKEFAMQQADWAMSFLGENISDEEKDMFEEDVLAAQDFGMSFGRTMLKWAINSIGNFVLALIMAAIMKRD